MTRAHRPLTVALAALVVVVGPTVAGPVDADARALDVRAVDVRAADVRSWTDDRSWYRSPWFEGRHRIRIPFGCTRAPYYAPDPRCPGDQGFHHGIDIGMRCGTRLFAAVRSRVVSPSAPGAPGSSYGSKAFRLRHDGQDYLIAHARQVFVEPGERVLRGQLIARAGDLGAPDGCHLHFEVRPAGGGYTSAVRPRPALRLDRVG